jgi:uncharacterized repeat protein (TIGR01451 family)
VCGNAGNVSVTCTRVALAAGATAPTITVVVTAPAQAGSLANTASVATTTSDPDPANNTSSTTTAVTASADLALTKSGPVSVLPGSNVSYHLVVTDNGPSDAASLSVTDALPPGVTFVSASGTGWTCSNAGNVSVTCTMPSLAAGVAAPTITVVVTAPGHPATLTNTADVTDAVSDPDPANNISSVVTAVGVFADLSLVKTGPPAVEVGGQVAYRLVVTNAGPDAATDVQVTDALPGGVAFVSATGSGWACGHTGNASVICTRPALAAGATAPTIGVVVTAPETPTHLSNTAAVTATTLDPVPGNNSSTAPTAVLAASTGGGGGVGGAGLPRTGSDALGLVPLGLLLLVLGGSLVTSARGRDWPMD